MPFPSFPPSGRVVSFIEFLPPIGLREGHSVVDHRIFLRGREDAHRWIQTKSLCSKQVRIRFLVYRRGGLTVQNYAEILHSPDMFVRRSFRGTDHFKYFTPETLQHLRVEREEEYHKCKGGGGLWGRFSGIVWKGEDEGALSYLQRRGCLRFHLGEHSCLCDFSWMAYGATLK